MPSIRRLLLYSAGFSVALLASALVGQYVFGLHPCELCILQRVPYAFIALIGFGGCFIKSPRILYFLAIFCSLLFLIDAGIAFYHTGVEYGFFPAPTTCSGGGNSGQTIEEMRSAIRGAPLVSCAQAMAYIFGLSMAAWNFLAAGLSFLITAFILVKKWSK